MSANKTKNKRNGNFHYKSSEHSMTGGSKVVRTVTIKNGKGYKSITRYHRGKKMGTIKKPIEEVHINMIKAKKFIPGLFSDINKKKKA
jgi:hypothetical protein